jgi:predicted O-methyltransferase YrrM
MNDIKEYANQHSVPIIMDKGLEFLLKIVKDNDCKNILELGTAIGYSSIKMAELDKNIYIDTIERKEDMYKQAIINIKNSGLDDQISCNFLNIDDYSTNKIYDLIFVDAAKAQYGRYLEMFSKNIKNGGIFFFDNISFHGYVEHPERIESRNRRQLVRKITRFRDEVLSDSRYQCEFYPEKGDGIIILKIKGDK